MRCDENRVSLPVWSCGSMGCWAWIDAPFARNCTYMVAEVSDGLTLEQIGATISLTRERVRQIEVVAREKLKEATPRELLEESGPDIVRM